MKTISRLHKGCQVDILHLSIIFIYILSFLFVFSKMSPLYPSNEWSDINVYYTIGKSMMNGKTPYVDVFDHKGPLIFVIYGLGYLISENSFVGLFIIQFVVWTISLFILYKLAKLFLNKYFSLCVVLLFPTFAHSFMHTGGSAEEFILLLMIPSLYFFISFWNKKSGTHNPLVMLLHGLLCGIVLLIKLNLLVFWIFPILAIFIQLILNKQIQNLLYNLFTYLIGVCIILIPTIIYFIINDALADMYFAYIILNTKYAAANNYYLLILSGTKNLIKIALNNWIEFGVILIGIVYFPYKNIKNTLGKASLILSGVALIGMVFYTSSYQFYYPLILYVFITLGLISIFYSAQKIAYFRNIKTILYLSSFLIILISLFKDDKYKIIESSYLNIDYLNSPHFRFRSEIQKVENPTLLSITFGRGCSLFTTSNIIPNIKYFITPNISYALYPDIRDEQTKYIRNKEVDFIVSSTRGLNYEYFETLPELKAGYNKIDSIAEGQTIYFLYRKK